MTDQIRVHTSIRIPVTDAPAVSWRATPEGAEAHAFADSGPGWMRSLCKAQPFNFRMERVDDAFPRCRPCQHALAGVAPEAPTEIAAGWGQ